LKHIGVWKLTPLSKGFYKLQFSYPSDIRKIWSLGTLIYNQVCFVLIKWSTVHSPHTRKQTNAHIWIHLTNLPQEYWERGYWMKSHQRYVLRSRLMRPQKTKPLDIRHIFWWISIFLSVFFKIFGYNVRILYFMLKYCMKKCHLFVKIHLSLSLSLYIYIYIYIYIWVKYVFGLNKITTF